MGDVNFLKKLQEYDKENIPEVILKKTRVYVENKEFDPAIIDKVSKVAKSMCMWVIAIEKFSKIYKIVEPKIAKQKEAEVELNGVYVLRLALRLE
jgi:dynein heavy chain, axonemal